MSTNKKQLKNRRRGSEITQKLILDAALQEFADNGLNGARVDVIAEKADVNKRMLYLYFENKEGLFKAVLESAYTGIRTAEQELRIDHLDSEKAMIEIVEFTWNYYIENPEFLKLVIDENLHKGTHLEESEKLPDLQKQMVSMVDQILKKGEQEGVFRKGIDGIQLTISIAALSFFYQFNQHTLSIVYNRDFKSKGAMDKRLEHVKDVVMTYIKA